MRLCMFTPADAELERGWPGRIDGEHVVLLAAQTLPYDAWRDRMWFSSWI